MFIRSDTFTLQRFLGRRLIHEYGEADRPNRSPMIGQDSQD